MNCQCVQGRSRKYPAARTVTPVSVTFTGATMVPDSLVCFSKMRRNRRPRALLYSHHHPFRVPISLAMSVANRRVFFIRLLWAPLVTLFSL